MEPAVDAEKLGKDFPAVGSGTDFWRLPFAPPSQCVLEDVSFSVASGEVFGLLGPNGAGKTTLLKILCTLLVPNRGRAALRGHDVVQEAGAARQQLGYCPGLERSFYLRLSAWENLRFYGILNNLSPDALRERVPHLLTPLGLERAADEPVRNFSTGMLQRLAVARALLHDPGILLFDEPTRSLDPGGAAWLRRTIREELAERRGCAVLVATHNLVEAEEVCHRLMVLHRGCVRAQGTPAQICRQAGAASLSDAYRGLTSGQPLPEAVGKL